jgi:hypothetical protein
MQTIKTEATVKTDSVQTVRNSLNGNRTDNATVDPWYSPSYEALKVKAQQKADQSGRLTCVRESESGFSVAFLTEKIAFSSDCVVQEIFEPGGAR